MDTGHSSASHTGSAHSSATAACAVVASTGATCIAAGAAVGVATTSCVGGCAVMGATAASAFAVLSSSAAAIAIIYFFGATRAEHRAVNGETHADSCGAGGNAVVSNLDAAGVNNAGRFSPSLLSHCTTPLSEIEDMTLDGCSGHLVSPGATI